MQRNLLFIGLAVAFLSGLLIVLAARDIIKGTGLKTAIYVLGTFMLFVGVTIIGTGFARDSSGQF